MARKTIAVDETLHAAWSAAAAKEGLSLTAYVTRAVEAARTGSVVVPGVMSETRVPGVMAYRQVKPKDCTNRVRPGTFCKVCGAIHGK